jgi:hypothetical protein
MAKAQVIEEIVTVVKPRQIQVLMSQEEAEAFLIVAHKVGGNPFTTRRGQIDAIAEALRDAGIKTPSYNGLYEVVGSIVFEY